MQEYQKIVFEIVCFYDDDIVATSGEGEFEDVVGDIDW